MSGYNPPDSGGAFTSVSETTLTSAAQTINITGLDGDADGNFYILWINLHNDNVGNGDISLYLNNDTTASNYYRQYLEADNATLSGARTNDSVIGTTIAASDGRTFYITVGRDPGGYGRATAMMCQGQGSSVFFGNTIHSTSSNISNITQINLVGSVADVFGVGSTIKLFRVTT